MSEIRRPCLETPMEAAHRLGLDRVTKDPGRCVLKMARRGELVAITVGKFRMIDSDSVDRLIKGKQ